MNSYYSSFASSIIEYFYFFSAQTYSSGTLKHT